MNPHLAFDLLLIRKGKDKQGRNKIQREKRNGTMDKKEDTRAKHYDVRSTTLTLHQEQSACGKPHEITFPLSLTFLMSSFHFLLLFPCFVSLFYTSSYFVLFPFFFVPPMLISPAPSLLCIFWPLLLVSNSLFSCFISSHFLVGSFAV